VSHGELKVSHLARQRELLDGQSNREGVLSEQEHLRRERHEHHPEMTKLHPALQAMKLLCARLK
jgi:hypothetical protein